VDIHTSTISTGDQSQKDPYYEPLKQLFVSLKHKEMTLNPKMGVVFSRDEPGKRAIRASITKNVPV
jgi:hypothetical protein